jgi:hypothetical protein
MKPSFSSYQEFGNWGSWYCFSCSCNPTIKVLQSTPCQL